MELWERAATLELLDGLLGECARGGRVAVVAGEAGIGKSVLVNEFARRCGARARVLWGGCDRLVTPRALGPLHDIGRQTGGVLAERLAVGAAQEEIFAASLEELSGATPAAAPGATPAATPAAAAPAAIPAAAPATRVPPVVVVEDAHWADEATLDWLVWLGRRIGRLPALLVVTYRDDEVGAEHPIRGALAALPSAIVRRVRLRPLSYGCVTELVRRAGRDPATVHRLTGGNPLLVTELLASEGTAVPATVQDLILDRLCSLPEPARELVRLVSVLPTRADAAVVAGAADLVETCVDAGVLVPSGDGVAFRHELLRGAVEESLSPARRAAAHRRVLGVLARTPGIDPGRLVHHALNAGDGAAVLRHGQVAGIGAARQGAHREAAAHYRAAVEHAGGLPAGRRAELLEAYAEQAYLAGLAEEALRTRQAALELREAEGQAGPVGENLRWISRLAWWAGRREQAWEAAARLVTVLEDGDPQLAMAYSNQSQLHMAAHHLDEAVAWGERARELADRLGDVAASVHAEINVSTARLVRGEAGAPAALRAAHERAEAAGLADHAARALVVLATGPVQLAEYAVAARALEEALAYAAGRNLDGYVQYLLGVRAVVRVEGCDWDGALADAEASLALAVKGGVARFPALLARGRILSARGDAGAAALLEEAARQAERTGEPQRVGPVTAARCEHLLWSGDAEGALEEAGRGLGPAVSVRHPVYAGELALRRWLAGGERRAPSCAAAPYRMMIGGEWAAAAAEWERRGALYTRLWALALGEQGAPVEALRALDGLGAARAAQWWRGELRRRGFTRIPRGPRRATTANAAGLTPRQADVLALLAEGLSNAEIAARLSLSAKTVDHHISAVLAKLGVASRGQAAALAHRMNERGEAAI